MIKFSKLSKWDKRFILLAKTVSEWSKDPSTKCGAVIARGDNTIASIGFNGFPRLIPDKIEMYEDRNEKYSRIIHAEINAIKHSPERVKGFTVYVYPMPPCDRCAAHLISHEVKRIVAPICPTDQASRWAEQLERSKAMYKEAGIIFDEVKMDSPC